MSKSITRTRWNTYRVTGYTHQVGDDGRATGGVHLHQVRKSGQYWQRRTVDSNGRHTSAGPVSPIPADQGEALYATACQQ